MLRNVEDISTLASSRVFVSDDLHSEEQSDWRGWVDYARESSFSLDTTIAPATMFSDEPAPPRRIHLLPHSSYSSISVLHLCTVLVCVVRMLMNLLRRQVE